MEDVSTRQPCAVPDVIMSQAMSPFAKLLALVIIATKYRNKDTALVMTINDGSNTHHNSDLSITDSTS